MGEQGDLSDFERGEHGGWCQTAGLSISPTADRLGFSQHHNHLGGLQRMVPKRENIQWAETAVYSMCITPLNIVIETVKSPWWQHCMDRSGSGTHCFWKTLCFDVFFTRFQRHLRPMSSSLAWRRGGPLTCKRFSVEVFEMLLRRQSKQCNMHGALTAICCCFHI